MAASSAKPSYEGVFAINKPLGISSAQVIRDVQEHFNPSELFLPWFERERARRNNESHNQRQKRRSWKQKQPVQVKIGHGGTLDPMASGVLILGVGNGTKSMQQFLGCTKSYETVVLFGAATDTYDAVGKIVAKKPYEHVTKESVEEALSKFRGKIMQRPPIYSALKVQGKPLYKYAREGKEVPIEIQERPVEVESLEMMEWLDGGTHEYHWPQEEAPEEEKAVVETLMHMNGDTSAKRKRDDSPTNDQGNEESNPSSKRAKLSPPLKSSLEQHQDDPSVTRQHSQSPCPAPACRLRMVVTSGFYVRSLAHDLGEAVGSLALMSSLVRNRQGDFELGENVFEYDDLAKGEDVWGTKIGGLLRYWNDKEGVESDPDEELKRVVPGPRDAKPKLRAKLRKGKEMKQQARDDERQRNTSSERDSSG